MGYQLSLTYLWLINKLNENEIILREQNIFLKCCQPFELLIHLWKGLSSFHICNKGSLGQGAAKLLGIKDGGFKRKSAALAITAEVCASVSAPVRVGPDSNHSQSLKDSIFTAL